MAETASVIGLAEEMRALSKRLHAALTHMINDRPAYTFTDCELAELERESKERNGLTHGRTALLIEELRMLRAERARRLASTPTTATKVDS